MNSARNRGFECRLLRFVGVLRAVGVPAGSGEVLDALSALTHVDLLDRGQVKTCLGATLAKDQRSLSLFSQAFDSFFVAPEQAAARVRARREVERAQAERRRRSQDELVFQGTPLGLSERQKRTYTLLTDAQRRRLQEFLDRSSRGHGMDGSFTPLIEHIVRGHLDRWRRQGPGEPPDGPRTGDEEMDESIRAVVAGSGAGGDPVLYVDLQNISAADLPRVRLLLRRLAKRMATRLIRRYRRARKGLRIDFRRTIRANLGYGGVPIELRHSRRKALKPRILLVCDVSGSMARYSAFTMQFTYGLSKAVRDISVYLFAEELEPVSPQIRAADDVERAVAAIIERSTVWGKGTNLAQALTTLEREHSRELSRDALVIVVSDTKTLDAGDAAGRVARLRRRVRDVIWLNPVPAREWPEIPTVAMFQGQADMYECNTLLDLERVLRRTFICT